MVQPEYWEDLVYLLGPIATLGVDLFVHTRSAPPSGNGPLLVVIPTPGVAADMIQNYAYGALLRPTAQVTAIGVVPRDVYLLARSAWQALTVTNQVVNGSFYLSNRPMQEPGETAPLDGRGRMRVGFNVMGHRRRSGTAYVPVPRDSVTAFQLVEVMGGDTSLFVAPLIADAYPSGATFDKLVPGSTTVTFNTAALYFLNPGNLYFEAAARVATPGARARVGLFDLSNPDVPLAEITFTADQVDGEKIRSGPVTLPSGSRTYGVKVTTNNVSIGAAAWAASIVRA